MKNTVMYKVEKIVTKQGHTELLNCKYLKRDDDK